MRIPAEWEPQKAVLMAWPHELTDWNYMLYSAQECFMQIASQIARFADVIICAPDPDVPRSRFAKDPNLHRMWFPKVDTNDTWARDFGPISVITDEGKVNAFDFVFNGWGLKFAANLDNMVTRTLFNNTNCLTPIENMATSNFVLEGGSIDTNGQRTILTTECCLLAPNRNYLSREDVDGYLRKLLSADNVIWLENGELEGDDTDGHVDTLARFIAPDAIAYASCDRPDDSHYESLGAMEKELQELSTPSGEPYLLVPLPIPDPIYDEDGQRLPATYANFLICNGAVLLPIYGDKHYDALAIDTMRLAMPDYEIVPINCRALIQQHGSLHCMTMQIPESPAHNE